MLVEKIKQHQQIFNAKCENIKWVLGGHIAYSVIISRPDMIKLSGFPAELHVDNIRVSTSDVFGVALQPKDRQIIIDETLAAARRMLLADTFDQLVESFCRSYAILTTDDHADPYEKDDSVYFVGSKLFKGSKESSYFSSEERDFIKKVINPIRNAIRHNNGVIPPGVKIAFQGKIHNIPIDVAMEGGKPLKADLNVCNTAFGLIRGIGNQAFQRLLIAAQKSEKA